VIEATKVTDSVSDHGVRLLTMKLRYPKFVHGEFMTHRVFSRNASSSRAVPTAKLIEEVRSNALRARPVSWGENQKGMQAGGELTGDTLRRVKEIWDHAAADAAYHAERMMRAGAHKQIVNRMIEPFTHIHVIVTSTEWSNFFGLRLDRAAQPEMRALAEAMWVVFNESVPVRVKCGKWEWHLPFVDEKTRDEVSDGNDEGFENLIKVSVARCARVSYESHETGKRSTVEADVKLHDFLLESRHLSPFEHQATPDEPMTHVPEVSQDWCYQYEHGNFVGWRQRRKMIPDEAVAPLPEEHRA
jgi:thymidylate synthase ThyX